MMMMIPRHALRSLIAPTATLLIVGSSRSRCFAASAAVAAGRRTASAACFQQSQPTIPKETAQAVKGLEPIAVWSHFATLSSIPRPSGKEEAVLSYIKAYADSLNLNWSQDSAGNLCVFRPGSGVGKGAPPVILQGHVDMVTEKNQDTAHNFETDPILLKKTTLNGQTWIGARGTTLGADNGLGVAATLALLEKDDDNERPLPPIEALFTVDEETGLHGAAKLDATALGLGGRAMLNLDMEEFGDLFVGCAGGGDSKITIPLQRQAMSSSDVALVEIRVEGLMGGHSGLNIHEDRANAVLLCAEAAQRALEAASRKSAASLVSIHGGDKHNAIPREASAVVAVSLSARDFVEKSVRTSAKAAADEFGLLEEGMKIFTKDVSGDTNLHPLDESSTMRLLSTLLALPHGPIKYSHALPGLVETSNNLASVSVKDDSALILCSSRSSIGTALENTRDKIKAVAFLAGGSVEQSEAYPGWNPNMKSALLDTSKRILSNKINRPPGVHAVHAGLECGLLIEKLGGNDVDVISFGPTITGAHSPDERVDADTVAPFFELVQDILAEYAEKK